MALWFSEFLSHFTLQHLSFDLGLPLFLVSVAYRSRDSPGCDSSDFQTEGTREVSLDGTGESNVIERKVYHDCGPINHSTCLTRSSGQREEPQGDSGATVKTKRLAEWSTCSRWVSPTAPISFCWPMV